MKASTFLLALALSPAFAIERGGLPGDGAYVSGGIGEDEIAQLSEERARHSLWLITAAKGSGAYLSDAIVRITDSRGRRVFDRSLAGPWLLVDLLPGKYAVDVMYDGIAQNRTVVVRSGAAPRQLVFYFDVPAEVLPRGEQGG